MTPMYLQRDDQAAGVIRRLAIGLQVLSGLALADEVSKWLHHGSPCVLHSLGLWPILTPQEEIGASENDLYQGQDKTLGGTILYSPFLGNGPLSGSVEHLARCTHPCGCP